MVAIIAVLVAISIPIFTSQLKKARVAVNQANARAGEAAAYAAYLDDTSYNLIAYDIRSGKVAKSKTTNDENMIVKELNIGDKRNMGSYKANYNKITNDISSWTVGTHLTNNDAYKLEDYYFYHYIYTFNND